MKDVRVGDWVRFYRGGLLVLGVVEYIVPRAPWDSTPEAVTSLGQIPFDAVLEVRRVAPRDEQEGK